MPINKYALILVMVFVSLFSSAQQIDTTRSAKYLVEKILVGSGVLVGNVKFTGEQHAIGFYNDTANHIGIEKGIVLTSGNAYYILGPNKTPRSGWASNAPGDPELDRIAKGKTHDASILEFDFVTMSENLSFDFVFASEEYLEYVGSKFNDVFAFFITTPSGDKINIARLPDGKTPITVNTVNHELNQQHYIDNAYTNVTDPFIWDVRSREVINNENYLQEEQPPLHYTQFDGFTTVLTARAVVIPNEVYHIKIAIADVGDGILDSGVFLKAGSFSSSGDQLVEVDDHFKTTTPAPAVTRAEITPSITTPSKELTANRRIPFSNVLFDFDEYEIRPEYLALIKLIFEKWLESPEQDIIVKGHTDSYGSDEYNVRLSRKRAENVADAFKSLGVPSEKIRVVYFGEQQPLLTNDNDFGRSKNRRVEVELQENDSDI